MLDDLLPAYKMEVVTKSCISLETSTVEDRMLKGEGIVSIIFPGIKLRNANWNFNNYTSTALKIYCQI